MRINPVYLAFVYVKFIPLGGQNSTFHFPNATCVVSLLYDVLVWPGDLGREWVKDPKRKCGLQWEAGIPWTGQLKQKQEPLPKVGCAQDQNAKADVGFKWRRVHIGQILQTSSEMLALL